MVNNKVCCVVVTYNIGKKFYECFDSVINQVEFVVIVDNGSDKETINVLKGLESQSNVKVIYNFENLGIATALNKGVKYAIKNKYEWILTMDNDSRATTNMVSSMLEWYKELGNKNNVVSIFPEYIEKYSIKDKENCFSKLCDYKFQYISFDNTSGNLVKSSVFEKIGLFREDFFIDSVDHDFCLRIKKNNYKLAKIKGVKLLHSLGNTKTINLLGKRVNCSNHSALRRYYITRNRCIMRKLYKYDKEYIKYDRKTFLNENIKILLFEKDKLNKIKMSLRGYKDYRRKRLGKFLN
ncbi:TPA: glycosyltransferase family 2 protein [Clostridium perfringens]|nr:glycosyltransferase family 2 protein [Clostridium perfringens]